MHAINQQKQACHKKKFRQTVFLALTGLSTAKFACHVSKSHFIADFRRFPTLPKKLTRHWSWMSFPDTLSRSLRHADLASLTDQQSQTICISMWYTWMQVSCTKSECPISSYQGQDNGLQAWFLPSSMSLWYHAFHRRYSLHIDIHMQACACLIALKLVSLN